MLSTKKMLLTFPHVDFEPSLEKSALGRAYKLTLLILQFIILLCMMETTMHKTRYNLIKLHIGNRLT